MAFLVLSTALGGALLSVDDVLWKYGPTHAYALAVMTGINTGLLALLFLKPKKTLLVVALWGAVELGILVGNLLVGAQSGVAGFTQEDLTEYLLGFTQTHRGSTIAPTFGFYKLSRYSYVVLLVVQAFTVATALLAYRGQDKPLRLDGTTMAPERTASE